MEFKWVDGFRIKVSTVEDAVIISSNREGLLSLASHLMGLVQEPSHSHFHLDQNNSLEDGSVELIVERTD